MSLRGFHVVFITVSTLLAVLCALLCLRSFASGGGTAALGGALLSVACMLGLPTYGVWFYRKTGRPQ